MRRVTTELPPASRWLSVAASVLAAQCAFADTALLHPLFQDHAVLQRDQPMRIWGTAAARESLTLTLADQSTTVQADEAGQWSATLPAMPAGGPYTLTARTSSGVAQVVNDVLLGDVWLCSGQSNMQLQVHRALDSRAEIAGSANDSIRMIAIERTNAPTPQRQIDPATRWQIAAPATVPEFSASCFYFARELQKTEQVPMGLVHASWGGSKIEAWMSAEALRALGGYGEALDALALLPTDPAAAGERWGALWEAWWRSRDVTRNTPDPWSVRTSGNHWRVAPAGLGHWEKWGVPELESYNGVVWYRTSITLTAAQAKQRARLSIGQVDEADQTWVNGRPAANSVGFGDGRTDGTLAVSQQGGGRAYYLDSGTLKPGENIIVVSVLDTYGTGGLHGPTQQRALHLADGTAIPLDREWRYQIAPPGLGPVPRMPWDSVAGLTTIHNAMIAPLVPYVFRGVLWYQGESNTEDAERYQSLLHAFMADWRSKFGSELPFLIVQLANYGPAPTQPMESKWAELREAQRLAVKADPRAALAVAIDIGDRYDIHPANKQEVGRRLARAARHVVYGESLAPSGPVPVAARIDSDAVIVTFGDVAQRLVAYGAYGPVGFELCGAQPQSCRYAQATLQEQQIRLVAADVEAPVRVRYCWADSPVCTLYDESALPAGPFELAIDTAAASP